MNKKQIINVLEDIALYMEVKGENPFKISAYRKAAAALEGDVRSITEIEDITKIKGIGKGTGEVITELMTTGETSVLIALQAEIPASLMALLKIPGLGGKRIAKLYKELGIDSIESLKQACEAGQIRTLAGFGAKTEEKYLAGIAEVETRADRHAIWRIEPVVNHINQVLATSEFVNQYSVAGSYRRTNETSKDIDFIVATAEPVKLRNYLLEKLAVHEIVAAGDTKVSVVLDGEELMPVDFRFVTDKQYATALHHFTGSKDHNVRMRQIAKERGEKISEYGVEQADGTVITFKTEADFFAHFDLPFIPPAIRTGREEFERELPKQATIKADLHMHTTWSDGASAIHEMGDALQQKGYTHAAITDHSQFLAVANGLTPARLRQQRLEIEAYNKAHPNFRLFAGTEMDILPDATLDFEDDVLRELDFVIAAIHSSFNQTEEQIMARMYAAMKNPYVHMIAHPTGRVIEKREGYAVNMSQLIAWAKQYGKILELNANPYRLDLCEEHLRMAVEAGVPIAINTDAHSIEQLAYMSVGERYAQKAYVPQELLVNTWTREQFEQFIMR
ncbi:DNA polymerase/3'-5' exonuclease PolX [Metalysinibacillus saudimassiliensis]|uniref:DNA-directed DNA polymerase n=1 Tax=Metalysinibacillus saudimassiliensis TaxID=1461583 RepID=A0A078LWW1_9BACL|nr:DNA polymerase/3'-5' exonuclease PolX [Metalysinibacillus saudimassiliensis]